jgi:hypothetical protein
MDSEIWAEEEFGEAELGDRRRTRRLVAMARRMAEQPAGKLTRVYEVESELEGAYRFVENQGVSPEKMERTRGAACARRLAVQEVAVIPVDQTEVNLHEHHSTDNFGSVGTRDCGARGVHAMAALGLDEDGVTLGVLGLVPWLRSETLSPPRCHGGNRGKSHDHRPAQERESFKWIECLDLCDEQLRLHAPDTCGWYQMDKGADFWRVFEWAARHDAFVTVRACHQRVVLYRGSKTHLHPWVEARPVAYRFDLALPARPQRLARTANNNVRYGPVTIDYAAGRRAKLAVPLYFVAVTERHPPPEVAPIDWLLLTNFPVESDADAALVIKNYSLRWRCEDFFRTLKSGACDVEASELESFGSFCRFLVVASSIAARVERIRYLSRTQPNAPATVAYSRTEIEVLLRFREAHSPRRPKPSFPDGIPPLHLMTRWVAALGGYRYSRGRGPPGSILITRGVIYLENLVLGTRLRSRCD